ncbi:hypothetical protein M885DRAFT_541466 [Pelagophyceae sp. CCMP2097]|nr:hypothetical protein M885DRAFT_541466 [Pelagophyceae sp. CCMP2097]
MLALLSRGACLRALRPARRAAAVFRGARATGRAATAGGASAMSTSSSSVHRSGAPALSACELVARMFDASADAADAPRDFSALSLALELRVALDAAELAGAAICAIRDACEGDGQGGLQTREKAGGEGPVTSADLAADAIICDALRLAFPGDAIVSEEGPMPSGASGRRTWFVDPLDGTKNFVRGSDDWCVLVALVDEAGTPVLGVVHQPAARTTWCGVSTATVKRAWRVRDGAAAPLPPLQTALRPDAALRFAAAGPFHARFPPLVERFTRRQPANVPMGSAGLKAALLADGAAEVYASPFRGMHLWDVAAGHALLAALGGRLTALDNSAVAYATGDLVLRKGVFFSGPAVDDQLRNEICDMYSYISGKVSGKA